MDEAEQIPDWGTLDEFIFANRKLELLQALRERHSYTLADAIQAFSDRYAVLRAEQSNRFLVPDSDYWSGFYS